MARMHSRRRGRSGSSKPEKPGGEWLDFDKEEIEKLIVKLAKETHSSSKIGIILRDQYGIPDVSRYKLKITEVMEKNNLNKEIPEDLYNLLEKAVNMHDHVEENKKDGKNIHNLELVESKIRRLVKYYRKKGKLPEKWKYTIEKARLLVE